MSTIDSLLHFISEGQYDRANLWLAWLYYEQCPLFKARVDSMFVSRSKDFIEEKMQLQNLVTIQFNTDLTRVNTSDSSIGKTLFTPLGDMDPRLQKVIWAYMHQEEHPMSRKRFERLRESIKE